MQPSLNFEAWKDRLLLALSDADAEFGGAEIDLGLLAAKELSPFTRGWVRKAADLFERRGWVYKSIAIAVESDRGIGVTLTGEGLEAADKLRREQNRTVGSAGGVSASDMVEAEIIPAADRFVRLDHNSAEYTQAVESVERLAEVIRITNSPLFADASERLAVIREVEGIKALLDASSIRVAAVAQYVQAKGLLPWLIVAATGIVGNAAYDALKALSRLVGIGG